ncbi:hydroxyethylthiazole kinase [Lacticaseibacillus pabuli]|uniref:Hydroxyethylthiazole kinase n=1 Tax=Lacticaseibacillus pabuli TaxID=3025672 RepID=A0ABY7WQG3_9LACO|nr:hydroxyethylthiazole kinase [Lacticaseibacillus sp. KACC 23028]WDF81896.1 hydroxyethylthiazole kinase [Lacticaseibacillus sp. KACC 23028]
MATSLLSQLRQAHPLVVNYANFVTPGFVANGLNALGASPIMTSAADEATDLMAVADALVINLGTINESDKELVLTLADAAAANNRPIVLDPVAVGATAYRMRWARQLLADYAISVIRGNASEIAALSGAAANAKGIDAGETAEDPAIIAAHCATQYDCTVVLSGATDIVATPGRVVKVTGGSELLPAVVGSGDLLSSFIAAFSAVAPDLQTAAIAACSVMDAAAEFAAEDLNQRQPGTFAAVLMDALTALTPERVATIIDTVEEFHD